MTMPSTAWPKSLHFQASPARHRPLLKLGRWISHAVQAYADAAVLPYLVAFGQKPLRSETSERTRSNRPHAD